ncbi:dTDP-4-dehydrorhamnose 3,5-epimerase [Puniceibacterium sp. IMCC21224]|uniref:dTDP-4-dehydrorhamnose 3,5-epimerase n=1 Tax=Puniceibacterium sp. IMCC21224 TaxID=1618204 RepID=UPI00064DE7DE|nr:dTDP-4-dehydrorhamnose 3,5-epimerase [Puniceibacterium sp. IMCC21224]KMK63947.1 dTDP-4-dehydrorhamnose 3,5-epimerase [Puniceibacterium sp. IMCC21224]
MIVEQTDLPEVLKITPKRHKDSRGFFSETWQSDVLAREAGIEVAFVQDNQSFSMLKGTLRGLHYQSPPAAQDKLVRCGRGRLLDVAVDFRKNSPRFGQWVAVELSFENGAQLFVPKGFLHGFVTLEPDTEILYKCSHGYAPVCDGAVRWDDPDIGISWGLDSPPMLSDKDARAPFLADFDSPFIYEA